MHILGPGRTAFLEFLRNLTPATLVASIAVLLWSRLDFNRVDWNNWAATLAFFGCALTAALAFYANASAFLDQGFGPPMQLERAIRRLRLRGHRGPVLFRALVALTWRGKPSAFFEGIITVLILYAVLMVGTLSALSAAATALKNGLR